MDKNDLDHLLDLVKRHREMAVLASLPLDQKFGVVVVAGAYKGDTVAFLRGLYGPDLKIVGYEPQFWAYRLLTDRFSGDCNISIYNVALGHEDGFFAMKAFGTDACAFIEPLVKTYNPLTDRSGYMIDAEENLCGLDVMLLVLNVEGYEHTLLKHMENMLLPGIKWVLVQVHGPGGYREALASYHEQKWSAGNWELWELRP